MNLHVSKSLFYALRRQAASYKDVFAKISDSYSKTSVMIHTKIKEPFLYPERVN